MSRLWRMAASPLLPLLATCILAVGCLGDPDGTASDDNSSGDGPVFVEAAAETGLGFTHTLGRLGSYYFPETVAGGVGLLDYDGDGDLDVYFTQGSELEREGQNLGDTYSSKGEPGPANRLFRNDRSAEGGLRFTDVSARSGLAHQGYGMGVAVGDIDNDGDPDLYLTNFGPNALYLNNGDGTFRDVTDLSGTDDPRWSTSAAFVDYDRDGDLDLFVANYVAFTPGDHKRCAGSDGSQDYCGPKEYESVPNRLFRNEGGGRFSDVTDAAGINRAIGPSLGIVCSDLDGDGWTDLYVTNDGQANHLWHNLSDGTFEETALMTGSAVNEDGMAEASMGISAGDVDNDGDEDLFMTHLANETHTLYLNDGSGGFHDVTSRYRLGRTTRTYTGFGTAWLDYDNDGLLDLFIANGGVTQEEELLGRSAYPYGQPNQLFRNTGGGRFEDASAAAGKALSHVEVSRGVAVGDLDDDGRQDIVVANANGPARLLLNRVRNPGHWIAFSLEGVTGNRDAYGARVSVLRGGEVLMSRSVRSDGSFQSAGDARVHFGLGPAAQVDAVAVSWPGGRREVWPLEGIDRSVLLREGSGTMPDHP